MHEVSIGDCRAREEGRNNLECGNEKLQQTRIARLPSASLPVTFGLNRGSIRRPSSKVSTRNGWTVASPRTSCARADSAFRAGLPPSTIAGTFSASAASSTSSSVAPPRSLSRQPWRGWPARPSGKSSGRIVPEVVRVAALGAARLQLADGALPERVFL